MMPRAVGVKRFWGYLGILRVARKGCGRKLYRGVVGGMRGGGGVKTTVCGWGQGVAIQLIQDGRRVQLNTCPRPNAYPAVHRALVGNIVTLSVKALKRG